MKKILWSLLYVVISVWVQKIFPNWCLDLLLPFLIALLELEEIYLLVGILPLWIVIQEGVGILPFGTSILIFVILLIFYKAYKTFFSFTNILFVLIFSLTTVICHALVLIMVLIVQELQINYHFLVLKEIKYFFVFATMLYFNFFTFKLIFKPNTINGV